MMAAATDLEKLSFPMSARRGDELNTTSEPNSNVPRTIPREIHLMKHLSVEKVAKEVHDSPHIAVHSFPELDACYEYHTNQPRSRQRRHNLNLQGQGLLAQRHEDPRADPVSDKHDNRIQQPTSSGQHLLSKDENNTYGGWSVPRGTIDTHPLVLTGIGCQFERAEEQRQELRKTWTVPSMTSTEQAPLSRRYTNNSCPSSSSKGHEFPNAQGSTVSTIHFDGFKALLDGIENGLGHSSKQQPILGDERVSELDRRAVKEGARSRLYHGTEPNSDGCQLPRPESKIRRRLSTNAREACLGEERSPEKGTSPSHAVTSESTGKPGETSSKGRKQDSQEDQDDNSQGSGSGNSGIKPTTTSSVTQSYELACHYNKFNPLKFRRGSEYGLKYQTCTNSFKNIAALIQHFKEVHYYNDRICPRCFRQLRTKQELANHLGSEIICEREQTFEDEMPLLPTTERRRRLEGVGKKRPQVSVEDHWRKIWRALFPEEECPSSYQNPTSPATEFDRAVNAHMPNLIAMLASMSSGSDMVATEFCCRSMTTAIRNQLWPTSERNSTPFIDPAGFNGIDSTHQYMEGAFRESYVENGATTQQVVPLSTWSCNDVPSTNLSPSPWWSNDWQTPSLLNPGNDSSKNTYGTREAKGHFSGNYGQSDFTFSNPMDWTTSTDPTSDRTQTWKSSDDANSASFFASTANDTNKLFYSNTSRLVNQRMPRSADGTHQ